MNTALWILAGLLAVAFAAAGSTKLMTPRVKLAEKMPWAADATDGQVKAIGSLEAAGALGLVLPPALGIAPVLAPAAALGLALVMAGAVVVHLRRGEGVGAGVPALVLGLLALVVAWGRFGPYGF